jgi:hypothetical protein
MKANKKIIWIAALALVSSAASAKIIQKNKKGKNGDSCAQGLSSWSFKPSTGELYPSGSFLCRLSDCVKEGEAIVAQQGHACCGNQRIVQSNNVSGYMCWKPLTPQQQQAQAQQRQQQGQTSAQPDYSINAGNHAGSYNSLGNFAPQTHQNDGFGTAGFNQPYQGYGGWNTDDKGFGCFMHTSGCSGNS